MKEKQIPACQFSYNEHCDHETQTCQQCPIYWDFNNIEPQDGYEDNTSESNLSNVEYIKSNLEIF